jgi:hypothetical protein
MPLTVIDSIYTGPGPTTLAWGLIGPPARNSRVWTPGKLGLGSMLLVAHAAEVDTAGVFMTRIAPLSRPGDVRCPPNAKIGSSGSNLIGEK